MTAAVEVTGSSVSDFNKGNIMAQSYDCPICPLRAPIAEPAIGTDHAAEISQVSLLLGDGGADILPLFIASINVKENNPEGA